MERPAGRCEKATGRMEREAAMPRAANARGGVRGTASVAVAEHLAVVAVPEPGEGRPVDAERDVPDRTVAHHKHASARVRRAEVVARTTVRLVLERREVRVADGVPVPPGGVALIVVVLVLPDARDVEPLLADEDRVR